MSQTEEMISEEEILRVHGHTDFGNMTPRDVVDEGVWKYALGYSGGYTQYTILREHKLLTKGNSRGFDAVLTKKGRRYARRLVQDGRIVFK